MDCTFSKTSFQPVDLAAFAAFLGRRIYPEPDQQRPESEKGADQEHDRNPRTQLLHRVKGERTTPDKGYLIRTKTFDERGHITTAQARVPDPRIETTETILRHFATGDLARSGSRCVSFLEPTAEVERE
jgi:hypothetical protein